MKLQPDFYYKGWLIRNPIRGVWYFKKNGKEYSESRKTEVHKKINQLQRKP